MTLLVDVAVESHSYIHPCFIVKERVGTDVCEAYMVAENQVIIS